MSPYPVSEDTLLILDHVPCKGRVLDMGTGNGSFALKCAEEGHEVMAVDIDEDALNALKAKAEERRLKIEIVHSDLFENVDRQFDTVVFNPPYLPGDAKTIEDLQWAGGGEHGDEIIMRFLGELGEHLKEDGVAYIILSSFNRIDEIMKFPFKFTLVAKRKFSFHEIYLYELRKRI